MQVYLASNTHLVVIIRERLQYAITYMPISFNGIWGTIWCSYKKYITASMIQINIQISIFEDTQLLDRGH